MARAASLALLVALSCTAPQQPAETSVRFEQHGQGFPSGILLNSTICDNSSK